MKVLVLMLLCCFSVAAQNLRDSPEVKELTALSDELKRISSAISELDGRRSELIEKLDRIDESDQVEAKRREATIVRLFGETPFENEPDEVFGMRSGYTFRTSNTGDGYFASALYFFNGKFSFDDDDGNHGFIVNLEKIAQEDIGPATTQLAALEKYVPPADRKEVRSEFSADGFIFENSAEMSVGATYLLRVISYAADGGLDNIYSLHVRRQDSDGSIIVFIKTVKEFPRPPKKETDRNPMREIREEGMRIDLTARLAEQGFRGVEIEFAGDEVIVRGTVPSGKRSAVISFLNKQLPIDRVVDRLTEQ